MKARPATLSLVLMIVLGVGSACTPGEAATNGAAVADLVHVDGLGSLHFPNSGNASAQDPFHRGVLLLHSFEFGRAQEAFLAAQEADPAFALAYWGEAMTYNHPLWREQDGDAARATLARFAPTGEERRAAAGSEREAMYLDAIETLYGEGGDKTDRDMAYMRAMEALSQAFPDDDEARTFYSLSILGSKNGSREFATYMKAAAVAQPVFLRNPLHPGAAHYLIHSFDDPIHAPLGLPAANAYAEIAPNAAHAQHMTTHIFVAMGMWDRVVTVNTRARDTQDGQRAERGMGPNLCGHYSSWLHYGHLQKGEWAQAEALMDLCHSLVAEAPTGSTAGYFVAMRARHVVDAQAWDMTDRWRFGAGATADLRTGLLVHDRVTDAMAALVQGDPAPARALVAADWPDDPILLLQRTQLEGLLAIWDGRTEAGIELLQAAAQAEDGLPFEFGPPRPVKPTFELLGEALLEAGRPEEAVVAFTRSLERTPGRTLSEDGLQSALSGS